MDTATPPPILPARMNPEIQKAVDAGKLSAAAGAALEQLSAGTFVMHKSWGFGQVDTVNFLVNQMTINFKTKKGHSMQLQYAAESLLAIPPEHIRAQMATDLAAIKTLAKDKPVDLMRLIVSSHGGKATQDQITQTLVPEVMNEAEFKRWFESTKKALKADGHFAIPSKKGLPFELREGQISHADEYLATFNSARQLKDQIKALEVIVKSTGEFKDPVAQLQPVVNAVNDTARKSVKIQTQVTEALSLIVTRDELLEKVPGLNNGTDAPSIAAVLIEEAPRLSTLMSALPAAKLKRTVAAFPVAFPEDWVSKAQRVVLNATDARTVEDTAKLFIEQGQTEALYSTISRAISEHSLSSPALLWLGNSRTGPLSDLLNTEFVGAVLSALERDQHNEKKDRKLHDLLMNDQELLVDLISDATSEHLRDLMRKLLMTTVFEDLNKRSLLGRIVRVYPELSAMITGGGSAPEEKQEALVVSWDSLEKRKIEYDELVNKKIPENVKEISIARSYGDLRENFEFKAAKEMQRVLGRRRSEMERDLSLARGTDFANADTTQVSIGTIVTLKELANGQTDVYSILGAWDGDPTKGIISYQSALAQAVIGHKVGEQLDVPTEHGERKVEIVKIEAYRPA